MATQAESRDPEMASREVEMTAVPLPPPPSTQEPAATARETQAAVDEDVQAVANLLVAEGLGGLPSNISTPGRSVPTSSGGGTPQYFDLSGQKVMPTRHEDRARDLFHGKVTPIMLQVETVSAVDLPEGCHGEFVLDHAHLHLLDRIQSWCNKDVSDDHPEVTRMQQPDRTWSFMVDRVVQLILKVLGLPPHTPMIQMGDEGAALSAGILPMEPPVMISVTTVMDGVPMVTVQTNPGEPWSDSNLSREERGPEAAQGKDEQMPPEREVQQTGGDAMEEEPVKKVKKRRKEAAKKKTAKAAKRARKLSSSEESRALSPEPVASGSSAVMSKVAPEKTTAEEEPSRPRSPLPFHDEGLEEAPAEMPNLETEQEVAAAWQKSQPTPEVQ